jgi:eukaryotic-like serine/threonine-protein kinase
VDRALSSIDAVASAVEHEPLELAGHTSPDGAVTLVFSDIEGSTAMIERLGEQRWFETVRDHNAVVRELTKSHDGTVVKSQGDGFMLAFSSAHAAVRCAIEMERTFGARSRSAEPLRVRIGVHSGSVIEDADDFYGRNVVLAARIADSAGGGEILVSGVVKQYTESDQSLDFEDRGSFRFKGLHGEHAVYALLWQAAA